MTNPANDIISGEVHYYLINYFLIPVLLLVIIYFNHKYFILHSLFKKGKNAIMGWILKIELDHIFKKGNQKALNKHYIDNALLEAQSSDMVRMKNGIQQLIQFHDDERVIKVLIEILYREKDFYNKCLIIYALKEICDRQLKEE